MKNLKNRTYGWLFNLPILIKFNFFFLRYNLKLLIRFIRLSDASIKNALNDYYYYYYISIKIRKKAIIMRLWKLFK